MPETKQSYLSLDAIHSVNDLLEEDVEVPEWGGVVRVRSLSLKEMRSIRRQITNPETGYVDESQGLALIAGYGLVQPAVGPEGAMALMEKNAAVIGRISGRVVKLTPIAKEAEAAAAAFRALD
jgi:hypothetical protein